MPLHFSDEEMDLLLELSRPIEPAQRSAFLDAVAAAIEGQGAGRASSTRWAGGSSGSFGRPRSFRPTRRRPCIAAAPPVASLPPAPSPVSPIGGSGRQTRMQIGPAWENGAGQARAAHPYRTTA